MVFRLPTHLDTFVPPPSAQILQSSPWRGTLLVSGLGAFDKNGYQEIWATAVEVEGDSQTRKWPPQFFPNITLHRSVLKDMEAWLGRHQMPTCIFMADRIREPTHNSMNQANFRTLAKVLVEGGMVAVAQWNSEEFTRAALVLYPAQNSTSLLHCAVFLDQMLPDFLSTSSTAPLSPSRSPTAQSSLQASYDSSSRYSHVSQGPIYLTPSPTQPQPFPWPARRGDNNG